MEILYQPTMWNLTLPESRKWATHPTEETIRCEEAEDLIMQAVLGTYFLEVVYHPEAEEVEDLVVVVVDSGEEGLLVDLQEGAEVNFSMCLLDTFSESMQVEDL
jgi:hypothetical protein